MKTPLSITAGALLVSLTFTSCETPGRTALLGAGAGAVLGNQSHTGPLRGAAIGAGVGYLVGRLADRARRDRYYDEDRYGRHGYPLAEPTNRRGFVTSPYSPHNLIDVRGIPGGAKVVDPSNGRVFINP